MPLKGECVHQKAAGSGNAERSCVNANVSRLARVLFLPRTGWRPEEAFVCASSTARLEPYPEGGVSDPECDAYGPRFSASIRKG